MEDRISKDSPETLYHLFEDLRKREEELKRPIIDKSTLIPIGFVLTIAMGIWFISGLFFDVQASKVRIDKLEDALIKITDVQVQIASINTKVDNLNKLLNK